MVELSQLTRSGGRVISTPPHDRTGVNCPMPQSSTCLNCRKIFIPYPQTKGKFCSPECYRAFRVQPPQQRFWSKVDVQSGDCWNWTGALSSSNGYAAFWDGERQVVAHRFSWELRNGPIPDGLCVLHRCDNRRCVNPNHLFLGTKSDNTRDMLSKGRGWMQVHPGPLFTSEEVIMYRERFRQGSITIAALAREHGVLHEAMRKMLRGITYPDVTRIES